MRATLNAVRSKCGAALVPSNVNAMRRKSLPVAIALLSWPGLPHVACDWELATHAPLVPPPPERGRSPSGARRVGVNVGCRKKDPHPARQTRADLPFSGEVAQVAWPAPHAARRSGSGGRVACMLGRAVMRASQAAS